MMKLIKLNKVLGDFAEPQAHEASWNQFEHWTHRQLHQPKARSVFKGSIWLARQDIPCHPSTGSDTVDLHKRRGSLAMLQKLMEEMHLKRESMLFLWYQFAALPDGSLLWKKTFGMNMSMWMCVKCNRHGKNRVTQNPEALFISRQLWSKGVRQNAAWVHRQLGDLLRSRPCLTSLTVWQISKVNEHGKQGTWLSSWSGIGDKPFLRRMISC